VPLKKVYSKRRLRKRRKILPVRGVRVSPGFEYSPRIRGYRELIKTISAFSEIRW